MHMHYSYLKSQQTLHYTPSADYAHLSTNYDNTYSDCIDFFVDYVHNSNDCVNTPNDWVNIIVDSTNTPDTSSLDLCIPNLALL